MTGYDVTIHILEPTMIGAGPASGNHTSTLRYIPGGTLRGALAQRWIVRHGTPDSTSSELTAEFGAIFESNVSFGPSHVIGSRIHGISELHLKYQRDYSLERLIDLAVDETPSDMSAYQQSRGEIDGVDTIEVARTALTAEETAASGQLFTREALAPGTVLRGQIGGEHPWLDGICDEDLPIRLGGRRTVNGSAVVRLTKTAPVAVPAGDGPVVVRLVSPAILIDNACRPQTGFDPASIARAVGIDSASVTVLGSWVRTEIIHGWHIASGLPKPDDMALSIGSTALVQFPAGTDLSALVTVGIGLRTSEGFGRCVINPERPTDEQLRSAATQHAPAVGAYTQIAEHWFSLGQQQTRGLLRTALQERSAGREPSIVDILGRGAIDRMPDSYQDEFNDLVTGLSIDELDDLLALVDASIIEERHR